MRNLISYHYHLEPNDIHQTKNSYEFRIENEHYRLQEIYNNNVNNIYETSLELYQRGIYTHQIVKTIMNELIVSHNKKNYVLIKYYDEFRDKIDINTIKNTQISDIYFDKTKIINTSNWGKLWSEKIDYFEYQMNQFGIKYPVIRDSFAYYLGLAEAGIALFNAYYNENYELYLSHKRIKSSSSIYDLYNPFNLTLDLKVRDVAEYFKSIYLEEDVFEKIEEYLEEETKDYEKIMFFIRMFYPSFYFDVYEEVMDSGEDDKRLEEVIKKSSQYELLLKKIYNYLIKTMNLPYISWLRNI